MNQLFKTLIGKTKYTLVIFLLIPQLFIGQNDYSSSRNQQLESKNQETFKTICFGESIKINKVDSSANWTIISTDLGLHIDLKGSEINSFVFEKPGNYFISFSESKHAEDSCNHSNVPESFLVKVSPVKMIFDFSTLTFTKNIEAGINLENTEMVLNVNVKSFDNKQVVFENGKMTSAGIGTTIVGNLTKNNLILHPGINKLTYKISGSATKDTYIMFDFFDINNQVQSYYFPTKL